MKKMMVFLPVRYRVRNMAAYEVPYEENRNGECRVYNKEGKLTKIITAKECAILETQFNREMFGFKGFNTLYAKFKNNGYGRNCGNEKGVVSGS